MIFSQDAREAKPPAAPLFMPRRHTFYVRDHRTVSKERQS
jgi:hypothetical protein